MAKKERYRYRVEVDVEADEPLSEEQLRDAFTASTFGLVEDISGSTDTKLVRAWPRRGTEFKT